MSDSVLSVEIQRFEVQAHCIALGGVYVNPLGSDALGGAA
jgi:hypothetical protein